jgi:cell division protein FtsB
MISGEPRLVVRQQPNIINGGMVMRVFLAVLLALALFIPRPALAIDQADLVNKIDELSKELERLKQQMQEMQKKEEVKEQRITKVEKKADEAKKPSWLEIGGDYQFRLDSLKGDVHDYVDFVSMQQTMAPYLGQNIVALCTADPANPVCSAGAVNGYTAKNDALFTNRFGLNVKARATEDITVKARLLMYKVWGHQTSDPVSGSNAFFADKLNVFDGNTSHIPEDSVLRVDQAYATWSNVFGQPVWLSVGRRPSTGGMPTNLRRNVEKTGASGTPGLLVDYAFDGAVLGYAPDIEKLPGAYVKLCYGKGFDSGFRPANNGLRDVNFLGVDLALYSTDNLHVELQWDRAFSIFAFPEATFNSAFGARNDNLGDIDNFGTVVTGKFEKLGPGDLNLFASAALSMTHPNSNRFSANIVTVDPNTGQIISVPNAPIAGLLDDGTDKDSHTGQAIYLGARYDFTSTGTKIGAEYNYGSKNWITFTPASDDMWTSKLGTRGDVLEAYLIQELKQKAVSKYGKAYFRLGYQYYNFDYTGSNNWIGAPHEISDLTTTDPSKAQLFAPLENAHDIYLTFNVEF